MKALGDTSWIPIAAALAGVHWFLASSNSQKAKKVSGGTLFPGSLPIRLLFTSNCMIGICGAASTAYVHYMPQNWIATLVFSTLAVGSVHYWPETILVSRTGISQSRFLGLGTRSVGWNDIECLAENPESGSVEVVPAAGARIIHSKLHVGRKQFLDEVRKRFKAS